MSVTSVTILPGSRTAKFDKDRNRTIGYTLVVKTSDRGDGPLIVLSDPAVPRIGDSYELLDEADEYAYCISKGAKEVTVATDEDGDGCIYHVDLGFDSSEVKKEENPLDEPVRYRLKWARQQKVVERTVSGQLLANTVGDIFTDPPFQQQYSSPILVAVRNELSIDMGLLMDYQDAVNSDPYRGAAPGQAMITDIDMGDLQVSNGIEYYRVTYEISFNRDGWQPQILNRGLRFKNSEGKIVDVPTKKVRNLKEDGTILETGGTPHFIQFETLNSRPFGYLGI